MYRTILVPLDGSSFAEHALPTALSIAERAGATVQIARVHIPVFPPFANGGIVWEDTINPALLKQSRAYLDTVSEQLKGISSVPVKSVLLEGGIADALCRLASVEADLIVMTTHGRGPLARAWLGSVADKIVRQAQVPVLAMRPHDAAIDLKRKIVFRHILVPLDGSELAEQILEPALALAAATDADVTLLRVLNPMVIGQADLSAVPARYVDSSVLDELRRLHDEERGKAQAYLDTVVGRLSARSVRVQTRVAVHDQPAIAILEAAKIHEADAIALATHGRKGMTRWLLGSVADKVIRGAILPVLVYRPAEEAVAKSDTKTEH
jgi:nucleotide-binding universal stress UspA family protein